jgi:hypothetical protein
LRSVEVEKLHDRADLRERHVREVEDVACPALLDHFTALLAELGLRRADRFHARIHQTRVVESLTMSAEVIIVRRCVRRGRNELERATANGGEGDAKGKRRRLSVHIAFGWLDGPHIPRPDSQSIGEPLRDAFEIADKEAGMVDSHCLWHAHMFLRK